MEKKYYIEDIYGFCCSVSGVGHVSQVCKGAPPAKDLMTLRQAEREIERVDGRAERDSLSIVEVGISGGAGTHDDPIRYEHVEANDPDRKAKLAAQREQFEKDAKAGKVLCLSDLMISHGM